MNNYCENKKKISYVDQKPEELVLALFNCDISKKYFHIFKSGKFSTENFILKAEIIGESHIINIAAGGRPFFSELLACTDINKISEKPVLLLYDMHSAYACFSNDFFEYTFNIEKNIYSCKEDFYKNYIYKRELLISETSSDKILNHFFPVMQKNQDMQKKTEIQEIQEISKKVNQINQNARLLNPVPETLITLPVADESEKQCSWKSIHAYPSCNSMVFSKSTIKFKI